MFDLSRLRGVGIVVAGGLAIFVALHFAFGLALGTDAAAIHPRQRPLGWPLYERIWTRVSAIDHLHHSGQLPADTRLGIYIGVSTTATGIQRQYLDARAKIVDRWIVLTGAGLSFENLENVMRPVFFCSLKPTTVVLGVHPQMLVGERYIGDEPKLEAQHVVGRRKALEARFAVFRALGWLRQHWAVHNRGIVTDFLRSKIYALRLWVFYLAGVSAEELVAPASEPWDEDPLWLWNMDDAENQVAHDQLNFWTKRGHFKPENYDPDGDQARSLVRMIHGFQKLGAKLYVVIMPLRSTVRGMLPPNAKPNLYEVLHKACPQDPPTIIDLQDAMPDPFFTDEAHLSKSGGAKLSKMVADRLQAPPANSPVQDGP